MKLGAVILCRYDSRRLPGKILMPIAGRPVLDWIVERLTYHFPMPDVVVATSTESSDDPIVAHCDRLGVATFRGSKTDVAERFVTASQSRGLDASLRVNGDNVLADPALIETVLSVGRSSDDWDIVSNVPGRTYGRGLSVELVRVGTLGAQLPHLTDEEREHVTLHLYRGEFRVRVVARTPPAPPETNFALDEPEDRRVLDLALRQLPPYPQGHSIEAFLALQPDG